MKLRTASESVGWLNSVGPLDVGPKLDQSSECSRDLSWVNAVAMSLTRQALWHEKTAFQQEQMITRAFLLHLGAMSSNGQESGPSSPMPPEIRRLLSVLVDASDRYYNDVDAVREAVREFERDLLALLAASPAPQRQDDQEDTRVEPLVVAQEHGDLSRKSQPDGSLQLKCSRCGRLAFGANIGDVDHLLQPNKRPCGGFFR